MDKILIKGGNALNGVIPISGAKNAALPIMAASLLTDETLSLSNVPRLADITTMTKLLGPMGVEIDINDRVNDPLGGQRMDLRARDIVDTTAPYDLVRKMRASVFVLGPLLARCGVARVSLPGGCAIGARPVDLHRQGALSRWAPRSRSRRRLCRMLQSAARPASGAEDHAFPKVSVGATENIMMAATLAEWRDRSDQHRAASRKVIDLADCLNAMGAEIEGAGSAIASSFAGELHSSRRVSYSSHSPIVSKPAPT